MRKIDKCKLNMLPQKLFITDKSLIDKKHNPNDLDRLKVRIDMQRNTVTHHYHELRHVTSAVRDKVTWCKDRMGLCWFLVHTVVGFNMKCCQRVENVGFDHSTPTHRLYPSTLSGINAN